MTMKHGNKPNTKSNKSFSDNKQERKHSDQPTIPARDKVNQAESFSKKHRGEDQHAKTLQSDYEDHLTDL